ncbi:hypothetical protein BDR26DRAFT_205941 [Obelidium mucronatum]|nr:hypothetical protein BDR26DRAFT_205941 [Obelidium mucronatum]
MQLINTLVSTIQSLVSTASKTILPDSLREELKFLRSYVRFCIESGEAHTLPYLFPNEYQVSSFATSEITSINVSSTVLLLRAIARVSAKAAVFLSTSSTLSPLSTADTTRMTRSYTTSSLLSKSRIERNATKSTSTTAAAAATSPPPTSPYGLIYGPPSGFQNGLLAHKRALGVPEPTSFVGVTPELLIMEGGDVSIDVTAMTDVMGTRTAAGATATTASESDLATEEEEGQLSFMDLDLDVEEAQLWGTSDVSLVGPPESTTSGGKM